MKQNVSRGGGKAAKPKTKSNKPTQAQMIASLAAAKNKPAIKPTAAITAKGQKATGLAKSTVKGNRFSTTAKTTVKKPTDSFAGYGSPFAAMPQQVTKGQVGNALLAISMSPGSGQVTKYVASKLGSKAAESATASAFKAASKGLNKTGAGGRLYGAMTPEGVALAGTRIGTAAQQSSRMANLAQRAENIAVSTGRDVGTKKIIQVVKAAQKASGVKKNVVGSVVVKTKTPKKKK